MNTDKAPHNHRYTAGPALLFLLISVLGILQLKTSSYQLLFVFFSASVVAGLAVAARRKGTDSINTKLYHLAYHDELTGLYNRRKFRELFQQQLDSGTAGCLMLIDLNKFKSINDTLGHAAGDSVLQQAAVRIVAATNSNSIAARLGGDEFVVLTRSTDRAEQHRIKARLKKELSMPFVLNNDQVSTSASIGKACIHGNTSTVSALMHQADEAMYRDKHTQALSSETLAPRSKTKVTSNSCSQVTDLYMLEPQSINHDFHAELHIAI